MPSAKRLIVAVLGAQGDREQAELRLNEVILNAEIDEDIAPLDAVDLYSRAHDLDDTVAAALREDTARYLDRIGITS